MTQQEITEQLKSLAANNPELVVIWLYGSRARNTAHPKSDYDLAVAFDKPLQDVLDNRLRPEVLAIKWKEILDVDISILDINIAPLPIAMVVVEDDTPLYGQDTVRRYKEEQRIMSMWELDYQYGRQQNA
jgi:predicted nucleotidyltransferase